MRDLRRRRRPGPGLIALADGRYAPSPTGPLHVGNLRTAVVAWLLARASGGRFVMRVEDLDRRASRHEHERSQLADLRALGLDWDGDVVHQSERFARYDAELARLAADGLLYPCYCSRREVAAAATAPHGPLPEGAYPGTCRSLSAAERAAREAAGRRPAWRVRAEGAVVPVVDRRVGRWTAGVDDFVVRRNDGTPAYQLAVVVDDADQGVDEVVRGDDLLDTTPRQVWLAGVLGLPVPAYVHVPLVLGPDGRRLAKRHGAVTLADLASRPDAPPDVVAAVLGAMAASLGLTAPDEPVASVSDLLPGVDPASLDWLPAEPWTFDVADLSVRAREPG